MSKFLLSATLVLLLAGCIKIEADGDALEGTSTAQAAEALTKALSFEGGELVEGLMPPSNESAVSLLPPGSNVLDPGAPSLMSFGVDPNDTEVSGALVQFEGASSHFSVDSGAFVGAADGGMADLDAGAGSGSGSDAGASGSSGAGGAGGSGGAGEGSGAGAGGGVGAGKSISLSYTVESDVCAELCDTQYSIKVELAVKLPGSRVSKHATATVTLDCTKTGNHDKCGKARPEASAGSGGPIDTAGQGAEGALDASTPTTDPRKDAGGDVLPPMAGADAGAANGGTGGSSGTDAGVRLDSGPTDPCAAAPSPELIAYQGALDKWKAAFNNPAVRDCTSTQTCLVHNTPTGTCFAVAEGFDTSGLDALDAELETAWSALTPIEKECNPAAGAACQPTSTCVADVCQ